MAQTPLNPWHHSRGAKMVDFSGWDLPVYYSSITEEHHAVRNAAGLFDVSHMGRLRIHGPQGVELVQLAFTNDVGQIEPGRARYGCVCAPDGGVIDDVIVIRETDGCKMIPNGVNRIAVRDWLAELRDERRLDARIDDQTEATAMVALQGPASLPILNAIAAEPLDTLKRFRSRGFVLAGIDCEIARTGYTGENGFEIICAAERGVDLCEAIAQAGEPRGFRPAGLGARDSLRIEACFPLYGHELSRETNPLYAGLDLFVKLDKPDFIGKQALQDLRFDDATPCLAAFEMTERAVPRQGFPLVHEGRTVGETTSGLFSPTLKKGVGMGYIESAFAKPGTELRVRIRAKEFAARVAERPLYRRSA